MIFSFGHDEGRLPDGDGLKLVRAVLVVLVVLVVG